MDDSLVDRVLNPPIALPSPFRNWMDRYLGTTIPNANRETHRFIFGFLLLFRYEHNIKNDLMDVEELVRLTKVEKLVRFIEDEAPCRKETSSVPCNCNNCRLDDVSSIFRRDLNRFPLQTHELDMFVFEPHVAFDDSCFRFLDK
jgi:hypothetical protein